MKKLIIAFIAMLTITTAFAQTKMRRTVDSKHPMWLIHVDVWNQADPQKIIDLIPSDIKPFVVLNLSLSCGYDTELNIHQRPQLAIPTYKSWATVCQMNNMWFTLQPASGGHTHIHDNDLETFEYFFKKFPNFLGWNFAEQFWGFNNPGDLFSSSDVDRIELFAKLIPMHNKYGGFLTISFCGNIWSHPLNPVGMMKRNENLLQACKDYPESILWLYKYTTSSCFYNNESVSFGPFVAGLASNYGVRYDNCGWNGANDDMYPHGSDGNILPEYKAEREARKYPVAAGIGTVMEQTCQNGGAVWDGPELIWTEDFQNLSNSTTSDGGKTYSIRRWGRFPGFNNAWIDMWRKVLDGTMYIPTQQEVIEKTKILIVNDVKSGNDEDKYATWGDLYDGLYKQTDPFNKGNGQWMQNYLYLKSTGRYGTIPMAPCTTELSAGIPNIIKKTQRNTKWSSQLTKTSMFNQAYPAVSTGDLFVSRYRNQLVTYTPYSYWNKKTTAKANIPLQYNTCKSLDLTWGKLSSGIVKEYEDKIVFYLNNYRTDTTTNVTDKIVINGATEEPQITVQKIRQNARATVTPSWDAETGKYTINVSHYGPIDLTVSCKGAETGRKTDIVGDTPLEAPEQPEDYFGKLVIEAEDMDYANIQSNEVTPYYSQYQWVRGQTGNGFIVTGTNTNGSLRKIFSVKQAGKYRVTVRYNNTSKAASVQLKVNTSSVNKAFAKTEKNEWKKVTAEFTLKTGSNKFFLNNTGGANMFIDNVTFTPADQAEEKYDVNIKESEFGSPVADVETAEEGQTVTITPNPKEGYSLKGWNIIHGKIDLKENEDGTFSFKMPEDLVTLEPIYVDDSDVYAMDLTDMVAGAYPQGWRTVEGTDIRQYPQTNGTGPRGFVGFTGTYNKALYWRVNSCDYGKVNGHKLHLVPGDYKLTFAMAAWKGAPQYKAQILTANDAVVEQTQYLTASPNADGKGDANLSASPKRTLEFTITKEGDYVINFVNNGTAFSEFLLLACSVQKVPTPTDIDGAVLGEDLMNSNVEIFDEMGRKRPSLQRGLNIIRRNGFDVKKVYIK